MKIGVASPHLIPRHAICDPLLTRRRPARRDRALRHRRALARGRGLHGRARGAVGRPRPRPPAGRQEPALGRAGADRRGPHRPQPRARRRGRLRPRGAHRDALRLACWPASRSATPASPPRTRCSSPSAPPRTPRTASAPGLLLPYVMEFNRPARPAEIAELSRADGRRRRSTHVHALGLQIGLPGLAGRDRRRRGATCAAMAEASVGIKRLIDNNPRPLDADALEAILEAAWHGEPRPAARRRRRLGRAASREVADRALEVRGHARLGGGDVARLEHRRAPRGARCRSPTATPSSGAAGRRRAGSRRSASRTGAPAAGEPTARDERLVERAVGRRRPRSSRRRRVAPPCPRSPRVPARAERRARAPRARRGTPAGCAPRTGRGSRRGSARGCGRCGWARARAGPRGRAVWIAARTVGRATPNSAARSSSGRRTPGSILPSRMRARNETTTASVVEIGRTASPLIRPPRYWSAAALGRRRRRRASASPARRARPRACRGARASARRHSAALTYRIALGRDAELARVGRRRPRTRRRTDTARRGSRPGRRRPPASRTGPRARRPRGRRAAGAPCATTRASDSSPLSSPR